MSDDLTPGEEARARDERLGTSPTYTGSRTCVFCRRSWPLDEVDYDAWTTVELAPEAEYLRCPDCTAEGRTTPPDRDEERTVMGDASAAALDVCSAQLAAVGGRVLAACIMIHADGITPSAGLHFGADSEDGPQSARDMLDFMVLAVSRFAEANGIPFAVADMPVMGQG